MAILEQRHPGKSGHHHRERDTGVWLYGAHTVFLCNTDRAARRRSILAQLALAHRRTALRRLEGRR